MKKELTFLQKTKRFLEPLKQDKLVYFLGIFIYFMWSIDKVIHVLFLERIIHFLENSDQNSFYLTLKIYLIYIICYMIFLFFSRKRGRPEINNTAIKFLQNIYMKKFVRLNNNYVEKFGTGKLMAIIDKGLNRWGELILEFLRGIIGIIVSFVFTSYMLIKVDRMFFFVFIFVYFAFYFISYFLNLGALKHRRKRRDTGNNHTKNLVKIIMSKQEILQSEKINHEVGILDYYCDKEIYYNKKVSNFLQPLFKGPNIVGTFIIIYLFYNLGNAYLNGELALSVIVGTISALVIMKDSIQVGMDFFKDFTKNFVDIERIWDFFDEAPKIERYNIGKDFIFKKGEIELKNVDYAYVEGKNILKNFNLQISSGKITALVGDSGGGKSTIAKLVGGYLQYEKGNIFVDNQDLNSVSMKSYYKNIGYLTQEVTVFDGTVLENLTYAIDKSFSEKEIEKIIEMSKCEFIYELPNGLETEIGERGIKLSGGQRQRLAIAKIMLKNPKIIILDEPTSALDSFSEEQITKAMNNLFKDRTVLVIAHRLQTVKNADKIFVITNGKVTEEGIHAELKKKKGVYFKMLELQSGF